MSIYNTLFLFVFYLVLLLLYIGSDTQILLLLFINTLLLWEPYPSHHNERFSPLLVLRDFTASQTIPELSKTVRDLLLFYVTLSFLYNIISLPNIFICIFISDPFWGHNSYPTFSWLHLIFHESFEITSSRNNIIFLSFFSIFIYSFKSLKILKLFFKRFLLTTS